MRSGRSCVPDVRPAPGAHARYQSLLQLLDITERIRERGWLVDAQRLHAHESISRERAAKFQQMFIAQTDLAPCALGASHTGATHAVRDWFWITQGAPHVLFDKRTKRPQFNTETLIIYATDYAHLGFGRAAASLYGLRKNRKVLEFCQSYKQLSRVNGRIHFSFNPAGTQTGRWTSSTKLRVVNIDGTRSTYSANAQQVPSKTPKFDFGEGPETLVDSLRDVFIADPGCVLLKADYEALELRLIAYVYGAKKIIDAINEGRDTHMMNAEAVFSEMQLDFASQATRKAARNCAKTLAYAVSYQMHDERGGGKYPTLFKALKKEFPTMVEQQANIYAERFFELHPEIKRGQSSVRKRVDALGYNELTIDGRRLYYPATMRGYNQALNFPMQGTGGALTNRALIELDKTLDWDGGEQVRAQVHDELVVQAPLTSYLEVAERMKTCMERPAQLGAVYAGIPVSCSVGYSWGAGTAVTDFQP